MNCVQIDLINASFERRSGLRDFHGSHNSNSNSQNIYNGTLHTSIRIILCCIFFLAITLQRKAEHNAQEQSGSIEQCPSVGRNKKRADVRVYIV